MFVICSFLMSIYTFVYYKSQTESEKIFSGSGVAQRTMLSSYFDGIKNTVMDTEVFILQGNEPGGTAVILGGTHPNEPAGYITAVMLVEGCTVLKGKVIVVPRANMAAFGWTDPLEGSPDKFYVDMPQGKKRVFRFGSRATNTSIQWPDPVLYYKGGNQVLNGAEARNLNRAYPGSPDGNPTEKLAYAIMELIRKENADLAIDLHEASPEYTTVNALVAHQKAIDIAAEAVMYMEMDGLSISLEQSPKNLSGLSHREWGDNSQTMPFLLEASNPSQGRLRGRTDSDLIVYGKDKYYFKAEKAGRLNAPYDENGAPLDLRVARHLTAINYIVQAYSSNFSEREIIFDFLPSYKDIMQKGIGSYLLQQ